MAFDESVITINGKMVTVSQIEKLAEAMWQILDDMAIGGYECCGLAKWQARIAYEPFLEEVYDDWLSFEKAKELFGDN